MRSPKLGTIIKNIRLALSLILRLFEPAAKALGWMAGKIHITYNTEYFIYIMIDDLTQVK